MDFITSCSWAPNTKVPQKREKTTVRKYAFEWPRVIEMPPALKEYYTRLFQNSLSFERATVNAHALFLLFYNI
jgi:hypothetical protein